MPGKKSFIHKQKEELEKNLIDLEKALSIFKGLFNDKWARQLYDIQQTVSIKQTLPNADIAAYINVDQTSKDLNQIQKSLLTLTSKLILVAKLFSDLSQSPTTIEYKFAQIKKEFSIYWFTFYFIKMKFFVAISCDKYENINKFVEDVFSPEHYDNFIYIYNITDGLDRNQKLSLKIALSDIIFNYFYKKRISTDNQHTFSKELSIFLLKIFKKEQIENLLEKITNQDLGIRYFIIILKALPIANSLYDTIEDLKLFEELIKQLTTLTLNNNYKGILSCISVDYVCQAYLYIKKNIIEKNPEKICDWIESLKCMIYLFEKNIQTTLASQEETTILQLTETYIFACSILASYYQQKNKLPLALTYLNKSLDLKKDSETYRHLAQIYYQMNDIPQAKSYCDKVLIITKQSIDISTSKIIVYTILIFIKQLKEQLNIEELSNLYQKAFNLIITLSDDVIKTINKIHCQTLYAAIVKLINLFVLFKEANNLTEVDKLFEQVHHIAHKLFDKSDYQLEPEAIYLNNKRPTEALFLNLIALKYDLITQSYIKFFFKVVVLIKNNNINAIYELGKLFILNQEFKIIILLLQNPDIIKILIPTTTETKKIDPDKIIDQGILYLKKAAFYAKNYTYLDSFKILIKFCRDDPLNQRSRGLLEELEKHVTAQIDKKSTVIDIESNLKITKLEWVLLKEQITQLLTTYAPRTSAESTLSPKSIATSCKETTATSSSTAPTPITPLIPTSSTFVSSEETKELLLQLPEEISKPGSVPVPVPASVAVPVPASVAVPGSASVAVPGSASVAVPVPASVAVPGSASVAVPIPGSVPGSVPRSGSLLEQHKDIITEGYTKPKTSTPLTWVAPVAPIASSTASTIVDKQMTEKDIRATCILLEKESQIMALFKLAMDKKFNRDSLCCFCNILGNLFNQAESSIIQLFSMGMIRYGLKKSLAIIKQHIKLVDNCSGLELVTIITGLNNLSLNPQMRDITEIMNYLYNTVVQNKHKFNCWQLLQILRSVSNAGLEKSSAKYIEEIIDIFIQDNNNLLTKLNIHQQTQLLYYITIIYYDIKNNNCFSDINQQTKITDFVELLIKSIWENKLALITNHDDLKTLSSCRRYHTALMFWKSMYLTDQVFINQLNQLYSEFKLISEPSLLQKQVFDMLSFVAKKINNGNNPLVMLEQCLPGITFKPFDIVIIIDNITVCVIEVDGGHHYKYDISNLPDTSNDITDNNVQNRIKDQFMEDICRTYHDVLFFRVSSIEWYNEEGSNVLLVQKMLQQTNEHHQKLLDEHKKLLEEHHQKLLEHHQKAKGKGKKQHHSPSKSNTEKVSTINSCRPNF